MSEPFSPPPPPYSPPPPPTGNASAQVQGPATGLLVVGGLGVAFYLLSLVLNLLGTGMSFLSDMGGEYANQYSGAIGGMLGVGGAIFNLALFGFMIWGALKMKQMQSWTVAVVASILAMVPCNCCCIVGIFIGIWSLVVLMKPEVKAAFHG